MKCPFCGDLNNKVIDSRLGKDSLSIRRRRECLKCDRRFTTYEKVEEQIPLLIKKDGRREAFDRDKIRTGILKAIEKRSVSVDVVDSFIDALERHFQDSNLKEIPAREVGERIIEFLKKTDQVSYVRFASVYRSFTTINDFERELKTLVPGSTTASGKFDSLTKQ